VRLWINEESTPQEEVRAYFDIELKEALRVQGIDIRNRALTIEEARKQLYGKELGERRMEEFHSRLTQFATDEKLRDKYFSDVKAQVDNLDQNPKEFYTVVNDKI
jgi:hypothetical protein